MTTHQMSKPSIIASIATILTLSCAAAAQAGEAPIKEQLVAHLGWEVDQTTKANICTIESKHECQPGSLSRETGGFQYPEGVAVNDDSLSPEHDDVYVADTLNHRVQVLTRGGTFVLMFGWDVNKTKVEKGAAQAERNICTAESKDVCQAGSEGQAAGQFGEAIYSVTVDPSTGNVYVEDFSNWRVQEFTSDGEFVLMLGREVNETKDHALGATIEEKNVCTAISKDKCKTGIRNEGGSEPGAFKFEQGRGNLLTTGGTEDLLYVGDEHRVQEFDSEGKSKGEISLTSISSAPNSAVSALAVDEAGDVYLDYHLNVNVNNVIREFDPTGKEIKHVEVPPRQLPGDVTNFDISGLALDKAGRLAVSESEVGGTGIFRVVARGSIYGVGATSVHLITEFSIPEVGASGVVFDDNDDLYAAIADGSDSEVLVYHPVSVGELVGEPATCGAGAENETDATFDCGLVGEVNPWEISETEVWFEWGKTVELGSETVKLPVTEVELGKPVNVSAPLEGLRPNETFYYQLAGYDQNIKAPETPLGSERLSFVTPTTPPRIVGEPSASFVRSSSVVFSGEVNPENTNTEYFFEYGPCATLAGCATVSRTRTLSSPEYGRIGVTLEASGLQPVTTYSYRMSAVNEAHETAVNQTGSAQLPEGSFTTAPAPMPQATTGTTSLIGTSSAVVSGTVNPDGQPATYAFELGVDNGASTQYGIVFSGAAGSVAVTETLALSGLQPGTTYAYRVTIKSGYGTALGATMTFTTEGLPGVLVSPVSLELLPVPNVGFPKPVSPPKVKTKSKKAKHKKAKSKKLKKGTAKKSATRKRQSHKGEK